MPCIPSVTLRHQTCVVLVMESQPPVGLEKFATSIVAWITGHPSPLKESSLNVATPFFPFVSISHFPADKVKNPQQFLKF